jgi:hypothetical protein
VSLLKNKVYLPKTKGVIKTMLTVYVIILISGSILSFAQEESLQDWYSFLRLSLLYVCVCLLIFIAIKTQKIIISDCYISLKQIGITRHKIQFEHIQEVRKGKMSGSPIIEIAAKSGEHEKVCPIPYLPFSNDWDEILDTIKDKCGDYVIGNMSLNRAKGELRTWKDYN